MSGEIDDIGDLLEKLGGVTPTGQTEQTDTSSTEVETPITQTDTIQQSDQGTTDGSQISDIPGLINLEQLPPTRVDVEAFLFLINKVEVGVVNTILEVWSRGIEENKKVDKEELERAIRMGLDQVGKFLGDTYVDETQQADLDVANLTAFTMMAAFAIGQLGAVSDPTILMGVHNLNPSIFNVLPAELHTSLAMMGALITSAMIAPVMLSLTGAAEATKGNISEGALANQVAFATFNMVQTGLIQNLITNDPRFSGLSADQKAELVAKMNLNYLIAALTLYYKSETGWMTEEELTDLINQGALFQKIKADNPNDPRLSLVAMIRTQLGSLSAAERKEYLREVVKNYSDNPSYESSRELYELLEKMWSNMDYEQMSGSAA